MNKEDLNERLNEFEKRMTQKKEQEQKDADEAAERDRQAYLLRTGRKEIKP